MIVGLQKLHQQQHLHHEQKQQDITVISNHK